MNRDEFYYLGKILKTHGNKGHVIAHLEVDAPDSYKKLESVHLDLQGELIPFFISSLQPRSGKKVMILFRDFESYEDALSMVGLEMYIPVKNLSSLKGKKFYFHELIGFSVIDKRLGNIGIIEEFLEFPHQALFKIKFRDREILIPVVDQFILKIDRKNKQINITAPEGLIEIYL